MSETSAVLLLERLKDQFRERCRADLAVLSGPNGAELRYCVHRLAGLAGTLGYHAVSAQAAIAEDILQSGSDLNGPERDALIAAIRDIL